MAESEEELKSLFMKVKEESENTGLKLNIQKMKIMASGPITSWEIDGEIVETVSEFILGGSKITADGDCSHEIKRRLLLGRNNVYNRTNGTNLTPKEFYKLGIDNVVKSEKVAPVGYNSTYGIEKNIIRNIKRKM